MMHSNGLKTILSLCDYSGEWVMPYREAGYNVVQVDIKHGQDVRLFAYTGRVHGILAAPPCTEFASSGARWWAGKGEVALIEGLAIVDACLRIVMAHRRHLQWWALENPVGRLRDYLGEPAYAFDPCDFGDSYTKKTLLWGDFTPPCPLFVGEDKSVEPSEGSKMWARYGGKSERTKMMRSITPTGFARAFFLANQ